MGTTHGSFIASPMGSFRESTHQSRGGVPGIGDLIILGNCSSADGGQDVLIYNLAAESARGFDSNPDQSEPRDGTVSGDELTLAGTVVTFNDGHQVQRYNEPTGDFDDINGGVINDGAGVAVDGAGDLWMANHHVGSDDGKVYRRESGAWVERATSGNKINRLVEHTGDMVIGFTGLTSGGNDAVVGIKSLARWNGAAFARLNGFVYSDPTDDAPPYPSGTVRDLISVAGVLYLVGSFDLENGAGAAVGVASWNGASFTGYPGLSAGIPWAVTIYNGAIVVATRDQVAGGRVHRWTGAGWEVLDESGNEFEWTGTPSLTRVETLAVHNGTLLAGGFFDQPGAQRLASFDEDAGTWADLGGFTGGHLYRLLTFDRAFVFLSVTAVSPSSGDEAGGTDVTITGKGFYSGASVTFDGNAATDVVVVDTETITCTTPAGSAGAVDVVVTVGVRSETLSGGFTYTSDNTAPVVTITAPANLSNHGSGASIDFSGTAIDAEDGDISASLVWLSSIDGPIGTGASFSTTLSDGVHGIFASVTDSGGEPGSDAITITVG